MKIFRKYNRYYQRTTHCLILVLISVLAVASQNFEFSSNNKKNNLLKVKLEVVGRKYCNSQTTSFSVPNAKGNNRSSYSEKTDELHLQLKLSVTNIDSQPIILDKNSFKIARKIVSEAINGKNSGNIISDASEYIIPSFNNPNMLFPEETSFATLQPNDTYIREIKDVIIFSDKNSEKMMRGIFIKYEILSWSGQKKLGERLREKWKPFGFLWLNSIVVNSTSLKIDRNEVLQNCIQ